MYGYAKRAKHDEEEWDPASMVAPVWVAQLQPSHGLSEGDAVKLQVQVSGKPTPQVTWFREGSQIVSSVDFKISSDGEYHSLHIPEVFAEDSGKFSVTAANPAGQINSATVLAVEAPAQQPSVPQFQQPLHDIVVRGGDRVVLECQIAPTPPPDDVQWARNDVRLQSTPQYLSSYDNGICSLVIEHAVPEDSGQFSCTVTVQGLNNSTQMYLTVEAVPPPAAPPLPPGGAPIQSQRAPYFEVELTNQLLQPGDAAFFECKVVGYPAPEIVWTRKGASLTDKNRYQSSYDQYSGMTSLHILNMIPEDEGEYTCRAVNIQGEKATNAHLLNAERYREWMAGQQQPGIDPSKQQQRMMVSELESRLDRQQAKRMPSEEPGFAVSHFEKKLLNEMDFHPNAQESASEPPIFVQSMKNFQLIEGSDAMFVARVTGNPYPSIQWFHNGRNLKPSQRYEMKLTKDGFCSLRVRNAFPEDAGHYTCCATNIVGREACSAELYVEGLRKIDDTSYVAPETLRRMMRSEHPRSSSRSRKPDDVEMVDAGVQLSPGGSRRGSHDAGGVAEKFFRPVFRKVPGDQNITEGQMCRFDCIVTGRPQPELTWLRDGVVVRPDAQHKIVINEDGINSLIMHATSKADHGHYMCVARNRGGEDSFQVNLNIQPLLERQAPRFLSKLQNVACAEGQTVQFAAEASGIPVPMMSWQKDGKMITPADSSYEVSMEGGLSVLTIHQATAQDSAWYQCTAVSVAGTASQRGRLLVQVEARKPEPEKKLIIPKRTTPTPPMRSRSASQDSSIMMLTSPRSTSLSSIISPMPPYQNVSPLPPTPVCMESRYVSTLSRPLESSRRSGSVPDGRAERSVHLLRQPGNSQLHTQQGPLSQRSHEPVTLPEKVPELSRAEFTLHTPTSVSSLGTPPVSVSSTPLPPMSPMTISPGPQELLMERPATQDLIRSGVEPEPCAEDMFDRERPRPPKFKTQLRNLTNLEESQPAHFECRLMPVNDPHMKVEWLKDGQVLSAGHRFKTTSDFGYVSLDILYTYPEDDGLYICKATNNFGEDQVQAQLRCKGKRGVISESQLPEGQDSIAQLKKMEEDIRRANLPKPRKEQEEDTCPPVFDLMPEAVQVEEGDDAKFMVKVGGHPRPRVTWWLNGAIVVNGQRFKLRYDGMIHILEIPKVREYDAGTVRIIAKNPFGEAEASSSLGVSAREDWRSRLRQAPRTGYEVEFDKRRGADMRTFELERALKKPKTTVVELRAFERSTQEKAQAYRDEEVKKAFRSINMQHASMKRTENLGLEPTGKHDSDAHILRAKTMLDMPDNYEGDNAAQRSARVREDRKEPPTFTRPLQAQTVKEGGAAKLSVEFIGFPSPNITWSREGFEIQASRDFQIMTTATRSTLFIPEVFPEDTGTFNVRASNDLGMVECKALLTVTVDPYRRKEAAPEFLVQTRDLSIQLGEPCTFDCQISAHPKPQVYWMKDGQMLGESMRWKCIIEEDRCTLVIYEVLPEDKGVYECVVVNKSGKKSCSSVLNVIGQSSQVSSATLNAAKQVPQLIEPMRDQNVDEGQMARFQCRISAQPEPVVQWYYNNQLIKPSKYFQMGAQNGLYSLTITGAFPEDEGTYKCVARNPAGEVTCISHLKVNSQLAMETDVAQLAQMEAACFLMPLQSLQATEGEPVHLDVLVGGAPTPQINWFRENIQIQQSPDFQIVADGNKCMLIIKSCVPEDSGTFTVRASNPAGAAESSAQLIVSERPRMTTSRMTKKVPTVIKGPSPQREVRPGVTTKLVVQIAANPTPKITWTHNGRSLQQSQRFKVNYENNIITLIIFNIQNQDSGDYVLHARNDIGECTWKTTLNVQSPRPVQVSPSTRSVNIMSKQRAGVNTVTESVPTFVQPLKTEIRVKERGVAKLECQVQAYPPPRITWHSNGVEIRPSTKYTMTQHGGQAILSIKDAQGSDSGVYTCRAVSDTGEAVSSTTLFVEISQPVAKPPRFVKNLIPLSATDGDEVILSCAVEGVPQPEVSWFHNDRCIDHSEDFVINYDRKSGKAECVIVECLPDDQGTFRCVARNKAGEAISTGTLNIVEKMHVETRVRKQAAVTKMMTTPIHQVEEVIKHTNIDEVIETNTTEAETVLHQETKVVKRVVKRESGEPPRFSQPIQPQVVREGQNCVFSAIVTGAPVPDIMWLKDKKEFKPDKRATMRFDQKTMTCRLTIAQCNPDDIGVYSCRAFNVAGKATCSANVVVVPPDAEVTVTEKTMSVKKEKVTVVGEQETRTVETSPQFTSQLPPQVNVNEGSTATLECLLNAMPEPTVSWYKNGIELKPSFRMEIMYNKGLTTLKVNSATLQDSGVYSCHARNTLGEAITKTQLNVTSKKNILLAAQAGQPSGKSGVGGSPQAMTGVPGIVVDRPSGLKGAVEEEEDIAPTFLYPLVNKSHDDGSRVLMRVQYSGKPIPKITWYFNGKPIKESRDFQIRTDLSQMESTLLILEIYPEDEGEYMCRAENQTGAAITHCHMIVRLPSSDEENVEKEVNTVTQILKLKKPLKVPMESKKLIELQRQVQQQVSGQSVLRVPLAEQRRYSATLSIDHHQRPEEVEMQIQLPRRAQTPVEKSSVSVQQTAALKGMKMEVEVQQEKHERSQLSIERSMKIEAIETRRQELQMTVTGGQAPSFINEPTSMKIMDGEEVKFLAKVTGSPQPEVCWFHNDKLIVDNPDFRTYYNRKTGETILHIIEVFPQDTGIYKCMASNTFGKALTAATLQVEVFEYVADSEEATASQSESVQSESSGARRIISSEEETEFIERTQAFIANMQKLRDEIHEETVEEEDIPLMEEFYEETIAMADVKWQIPKRVEESILTTKVESADELAQAGIASKTAHGEDIEMELARHHTSGKPMSRVIPSHEMTDEEIVGDYDGRNPSPEMPKEHEVASELGLHAIVPKPHTLVQQVQESRQEESTDEYDGRLPSPEVPKGKEVVSELGLHAVQPKPQSLVQQMQGMNQEESASVYDGTLPQPQVPLGQEVVSELGSSAIQPKPQSLVQQMQEMRQEESTSLYEGALPQPQVPLGQEVVSELGLHAVQPKPQSLVQQMQGMRQEESTSLYEGGLPQPQVPLGQEVVSELGLHAVQPKPQSLVQQMQGMRQEESASLYEGDLPQPQVPHGQDVVSELGSSAVQPKPQSLVQQMQGMRQEESTSLYEGALPQPQVPRGEEVVSELGSSAVQPKPQSMVGQIQLTLTEEQVLDDGTRVPSPEVPKGQEVASELGSKNVHPKTETLVQQQMEKVPSEEEEDMFFETVEPGVEGADVFVPLDSADVSFRPNTRTVDQLFVKSFDESQEAQIEFSTEMPSTQEIHVELISAESQPPKPSMVSLQTKMIDPQQALSFEADDMAEDKSQESNVKVDLGQAQRTAQQPSLVTVQVENVDVDMTQPGVELIVTEQTKPGETQDETKRSDRAQKPQMMVDPISESHPAEQAAEEYQYLQEIYMTPSEAPSEYDSTVVEHCQMEAMVNIRAIQEVTSHEEAVTEVTKETMELIKPQDLQAPAFVLPLSDLTVVDGERAVFECRVTGLPTPSIRWFVNNQEIKPSADFQITYVNNISVLTIMDVLPEDEGEYTVRAVNDAGSCVSTAYLTVLPPSGSESDGIVEKPDSVFEEYKQMEVGIEMKAAQEVPEPSEPQAPVFVQPLQSKEIFESMPVSLRCVVSAKPQPTVKWYQEGKEIQISSHIQTQYRRGVCLLNIDRVTVNDEARYTCEAKNELGVTTTSGELLVEKLINAVEQVIFEEVYQLEIDCHFKWKSHDFINSYSPLPTIV